MPVRQQLCKKSTTTVSQGTPNPISINVFRRRCQLGINPFEPSQSKQSSSSSSSSSSQSTTNSTQPTSNSTSSSQDSSVASRQQGEQLFEGTTTLRHGLGRGKEGRIRMKTSLINRRQQEQQRQQADADQQLRKLRRYDQALVTTKSIKRRTLARILRQMVNKLRPDSNLKIQPAAFEAIHESAEAFLISWFEAAYMFTIHAKRVTVMQRDFDLMKKMKKFRSLLDASV